MSDRKRLTFVGKSFEDLRAFPPTVIEEAGFQLAEVQSGYDPYDWKPMPVIGAGVRELRIRDVAGAFRIIYVAKFKTAVYVLHCFSKKTQQTSRTDLDLAQRRYRQLLKELGQ